jgi:hypothetical protein
MSPGASIDIVISDLDMPGMDGKDWDLLRELGCDLAQGYLIAKPIESGEFLTWARDRTGVEWRNVRGK